MNNPKKTFQIDRRPWDFEYGLYIMIEDGSGSRSFIEGYSLRRCEPGDVSRTPEAMSVRKDDLQQLMDELWRAGFRPSEGTGSAGQLAATQAHLKDMQKLVFEVLKP